MQYDVTVIGSGPGGYIAAIRCAQLGMKTAIIEKYDVLGGTCLNVGCIPSKALLDSSEHYHNATHTFSDHGIELKDLKVNLNQMIERKRQVVNQVTGGVDFLMKKNKIDAHHGMGSFVDKNTVKITDAEGNWTTQRTAQWEQLSSHTARRTFATMAVQRGIPIKVIMNITGHSSEREFNKYVNISAEKNAELFASYWV